MGSNTSKNLLSNHQSELNNSPDRFLCDPMFKNECEKSVRIQSSENKCSRKKSKFFGNPKSKNSHDDAQSEEVESGELLGEGTNKTLLPQRHHLQTAQKEDFQTGLYCRNTLLQKQHSPTLAKQ